MGISLKRIEEVKQFLSEQDRLMPRIRIDGKEYVLLKPKEDKERGLIWHYQERVNVAERLV